MHTIETRVARLEERCDAMHDLMTETAIERRRQDDENKELLRDIQAKINKMHGYSAGVASAFGLVGAGITLIWDKVKITGGGH